MLGEYSRQSLPLDLLMNHYFRSNKALGSKDRAFIAQTAYDMIRWLGLLDALSQKTTWEERLKTYENVKDRLENPLLYYRESLPLHSCVSFPKDLFDRLVLSFGKDKAVESVLGV